MILKTDAEKAMNRTRDKLGSSHENKNYGPFCREAVEILGSIIGKDGLESLILTGNIDGREG